MTQPKAFFRLLRPKQWTKNLLVFAALLFTGTFNNSELLLRSLLAFVAMCLVSSSVYIFNDLRDREQDRLHPKKMARPLAAGLVTPAVAAALAVLLLAAGVAMAAWLGQLSLVVVLLYLLIQVLYNLGFKSVPVADVYLISTGFVLRAVLGAAAINVLISGWLLFCTGALALMLGFGKRRNEFILQGEARGDSRKSLLHYNRLSLDALVVMFATAAALCYGIYTLESQTAAKYPALLITAPIVLYGITRYVLLVFTADEGGEPEEILFKDPHLVATILLFVAASALAVSGYQLPLIER